MVSYFDDYGGGTNVVFKYIQKRLEITLIIPPSLV